MAKEGRIDILVNNAGINLYGPLVEQPLEDVRAVFGSLLARSSSNETSRSAMQRPTCSVCFP